MDCGFLRKLPALHFFPSILLLRGVWGEPPAALGGGVEASSSLVRGEPGTEPPAGLEPARTSLVGERPVLAHCVDSGILRDISLASFSLLIRLQK